MLIYPTEYEPPRRERDGVSEGFVSGGIAGGFTVKNYIRPSVRESLEPFAFERSKTADGEVLTNDIIPTISV